MLDPNDRLLGQIALEKRLVSAEQLAEAARELEARTDDTRPLGVVLLSKGYLTADQLLQVAEEHRRRTPGAAADAPPASAPDRLGPYELVRLLGRGGFGSVYLARQPDLERSVALKVLSSRDPEDIQRFAREARTAAQLNHPHIVPIFEVGAHGDSHTIAMEYVEGETLDRLRLQPRRAAEVLRDAAGALEYAHGRGIIHRDLKPQNLILGKDGRVRVMDFGLARQTTRGSTLTLSGTIMGTPSYMSPEQAGGRTCDSRSDVYSLGATLYQLLAGRPPFEGATALETIESVLWSDPPPIRRFNPKADPELQTIVSRAMEKEPGRRYPRAADLAEDLRRHLEGEPILARPVSLARRGLKWVRRNRTASAVGAVLLLGVLVTGSVTGVRASQHRRRIADLLDQAGRSERAGNFAGAERLYLQVKALSPGHPVAEGKAVSMNVAAAKAVREEAAARHLTEGRGHASRHDDRSKALVSLRAEEKRCSEDLAPWAGEEEKRGLWKLREDLRKTAEEVARCRGEALAAYASALAVDPDCRPARNALAAWHFADFERAGRDRDAARIVECERLVRLYDDGTYAPRLGSRGTLELDSNPTGSEAELFRFVPGPDGRLVAAEPRPLGTCPIPAGELPAGSYLVLLRKPGRREVRYPLLVARGTAHRARVNLYTDEEIGESFVYVPGGPFIAGGESEDHPLHPRVEIGDFFIARFEVTWAEYARFLSDLVRATGARNAQLRVPRQADISGYFWSIPEGAKETSVPADIVPTCAVMGISREDAETYCAWMNSMAREQRQGVGYRLPNAAEWEKAARGVDGRHYPWGNEFDWSFTKGFYSRPPGGARQPEPIGAFMKDESLYGARDLAGNMSEWCLDWYDQKSGLRVVRGGAWGTAQPSEFLSGLVRGRDSKLPSTQIGIRVVRTPPAR